MRTLSIVLLLLASSEALSAPAPFPKRPKPRPQPMRAFWEFDLSPLAKAGRVNFSVTLSFRLVDGTTTSVGVSQNGQVAIAPIIDAFGFSFHKGDMEINTDKTKMTLKSLKGLAIQSVEMELKNLDNRFSPVLLPPTRK
jgi:hypothetical protein